MFRLPVYLSMVFFLSVFLSLFRSPSVLSLSIYIYYSASVSVSVSVSVCLSLSLSLFLSLSPPSLFITFSLSLKCSLGLSGDVLFYSNLSAGSVVDCIAVVDGDICTTIKKVDYLYIWE